MTYATEFPDYPAGAMPLIPEGYGFVDTSWHNDVCPTFTSDKIGLVIWIDYPNPEDREFPSPWRFWCHSQRDGVEISGPSLMTDSWDEVLAFIAQRA